MQTLLGEEYPARVEEYKLYVMAQMSRGRCFEEEALHALSKQLVKARRMSALGLAMLESATLELISQRPRSLADHPPRPRAC